MSEQENEATALLAPAERPTEGRRVLWTIVTAAAALVTLTIGSQISIAAQIAILEDLVCQKYYAENGGVPLTPSACKVEPVQSEVAWINGWKDSMEVLPGAIPAQAAQTLD